MTFFDIVYIKHITKNVFYLFHNNIKTNWWKVEMQVKFIIFRNFVKLKKKLQEEVSFLIIYCKVITFVNTNIANNIPAATL